MTRRSDLTAPALIGLMLCLTAPGLTAPADSLRNDAFGQPMLRQSIGVAEAVDLALQNNPAVASRRSAVASAAAGVGMAEAATRPHLSASTFATAGDTAMIFPGVSVVEPRNFSMTADTGRVSQNLMFMYPLYTGGRLESQVGGARALQNASQSYAAATDLDVAFAVKAAYYRVLLAREFVDAHQHRVDEATGRVRIAEEAYAVGRIARYDLLRNQTDLAESQQRLNNSERDVQTALIDLKALMGISQSSELRLTEALAFRETAQPIESLTSAAVEQRPEVKAARFQIRAAKERLGVTKSAYRPQVYATAMANASSTADDVETGYMIGIAASLPVLDGGMRKSAVVEAEAALAQMRADERAAILEVTRAVAAAYAQSNAAAKNVALAQAAVAQAEEDYRVIRMRYEAGKSTNVEVLDALAALTRAQTGSAEALYAHNVAREALARAVGRL